MNRDGIRVLIFRSRVGNWIGQQMKLYGVCWQFTGRTEKSVKTGK